jgi:hypothetical protein
MNGSHQRSSQVQGAAEERKAMQVITLSGRQSGKNFAARKQLRESVKRGVVVVYGKGGISRYMSRASLVQSLAWQWSSQGMKGAPRWR